MNPSSGADTWYSDYSIFPEVWFHRGGSSTGEERAGIFAFGDQYGPLQTGGASSHISSRAVISNLK